MPRRFCVALPPLKQVGDNLYVLVAYQQFFNGGPKGIVKSSYWVNFVRVVDKAVRAYKNARRELCNYQKGPIVALISANGYIEDCLCHVDLAIRFLLKISADRETFPAIDKITKKYILSVGSGINELRDKIQHLENAWVKHKLLSRGEVFLCLDQGDIVLIDKRIRIADLASCISKLYQIAKKQAARR